MKFFTSSIETIWSKYFFKSPVGLKELHDVRVFEHVADGGLSLEVVEAEAGRGRELAHVHDLDGEFLARLPMEATADQGERSLA